MTIDLSEINTSQEKPPAAENLIRQALRFHQQFDEQVWDDWPSFHNPAHIEATSLSARVLVEGALKGNDPLGLLADLKRWNQERGGDVSDKELAEVMALTFAVHDLGNIMNDLEIVNGEVKPTFLPGYRSVGAEARSQQLAKKLFNFHFDSSEGERLFPLVEHLINQTVPQLTDRTPPFAVSIRAIDQIGNDLFSHDDDREMGLLWEIGKEKPDEEFRPYHFFNFARVRFSQLVREEATREAVLTVWGKEIPPESDSPGNFASITAWLEGKT